MCNLFGESPEVVAHKLDVLRGHCDDAGTDYDAIEKSDHRDDATPPATPTAFLAEMERYAALGVDTVTPGRPASDPVAWTTTVVEQVVPRLDRALSRPGRPQPIASRTRGSKASAIAA